MTATYTPTGFLPLEFYLLIDPPTRETRQTISERIIPGSNSSIIDIIGKSVTKIRGQARFDSYAGLVTFEGAVGTTGVLIYSEEPLGINVIFASLERTRVTPQNIHLANIEFWIIPVTGGTFASPRQVSVTAQAVGPTSGTVPLPNVLSARVSYGFDKRTGECRLTLPLIGPTWSAPPCTYDDVLTVAMGAGGATGTDPPGLRFEGVIRDFEHQDGRPTLTIVARGYLTRAIEYENGDETAYQNWLGSGGILIVDLIGSGTAGAADIVMAVLDRANVPYAPENILGSEVVYGGGVTPLPFMWRSGSPGPNSMPMQQEQGETAMSYIERYDAVDAQIDAPNSGGRYRTFETVGGAIFRVRVGGRPQGTPDFTLTEGVDILSGNFTRSITQTRNYFVVKGQPMGTGFGSLAYALASSNPFQPPGTHHTYQFSSDMIERANDDPDDENQSPTGMSCETLANAFALEYNREFVSGFVETFRDDLFGIAQTHLVRGGPGGTVGPLGLAENVWLQSLEISVDERGFTQRMSYLGGGLPLEDSPDAAVLSR